MKKMLLTMGITSLVMLILLGVLIWRASGVSKEISNANTRKENLEKDMVSSDGKKAYEDIPERKIVPLYRSGVNKNVITYNKKNIKDIYDVEKSAEIAKQLNNLRELSEYNFESPLISYNPFGTVENSLYISFHSEKKGYVQYTISVEDKDIPDFTRTCLNADGDKATKDHEITLAGLVPGMKNYIVMRLYGQHDEVLEEMYYTIEMKESRYGSPEKIEWEKGRSKEQISNGLYVVSGKGGKKGKRCISLYDNSGILRGEIPVLADMPEKIIYVYDNMLYACDKNVVVQVSTKGQVMYRYDMPSHTMQGAYTYDGFGNLYVIASKNNKKSVNDAVLEVGLTTGEVAEVADFTELLDKVYQAAKPVKGEKKLNWIDLNDIQVMGVNQILVSSHELSSIIKVSNLHSRIPRISYILADKAIWSASTNRKKVMDKSYKEGEEPEETEPPVESILDEKEKKQEPFHSYFGQSQIVYESDSSLEEGQYYLYVYNNNYGEWKTRPAFSFAKYSYVGTKKEPAARSYYDKYLVDETTWTYYLEDKVSLPYMEQGGNVQAIGEHYLTMDTDNSFLEMDSEGKTVLRYDTARKIYRVEKEDWKNFWFK